LAITGFQRQLNRCGCPIDGRQRIRLGDEFLKRFALAIKRSHGTPAASGNDNAAMMMGAVTAAPSSRKEPGLDYEDYDHARKSAGSDPMRASPANCCDPGGRRTFLPFALQKVVAGSGPLGYGDHAYYPFARSLVAGHFF
jgi:hypothetical protein